jgi:hypothetical protein
VRRKGQGGLLAPLAIGLALCGSPFACSSPEPLAGPGGACNVVTDCQDGLVCCNGDKGSLTCAASTSCLQPAGGGADAGNPAMTGQGDGGGVGDATSTNPPGSDAAVQDETETPEAEAPADEGTTDTGKSDDTGTPPAEAAPPPDDAAGGDP